MKVIGYENLDIVTNNHQYEILHYCELSPKFQKIADKEFDYLGTMEDTSGYIVYRRQLYNLSDFMCGTGEIYVYKGGKFRIDGHNGDSYFSSTIVEISNCGDSCRIARIYS